MARTRHVSHVSKHRRQPVFEQESQSSMQRGQAGSWQWLQTFVHSAHVRSWHERHLESFP